MQAQGNRPLAGRVLAALLRFSGPHTAHILRLATAPYGILGRYPRPPRIYSLMASLESEAAR